jgi:hypothetical protein
VSACAIYGLRCVCGRALNGFRGEGTGNNRVGRAVGRAGLERRRMMVAIHLVILVVCLLLSLSRVESLQKPFRPHQGVKSKVMMCLKCSVSIDLKKQAEINAIVQKRQTKERRAKKRHQILKDIVAAENLAKLKKEINVPDMGDGTILGGAAQMAKDLALKACSKLPPPANKLCVSATQEGMAPKKPTVGVLDHEKYKDWSPPMGGAPGGIADAIEAVGGLAAEAKKTQGADVPLPPAGKAPRVMIGDLHPTVHPSKVIKVQKPGLFDLPIVENAKLKFGDPKITRKKQKAMQKAMQKKKAGEVPKATLGSMTPNGDMLKKTFKKMSIDAAKSLLRTPPTSKQPPEPALPSITLPAAKQVSPPKMPPLKIEKKGPAIHNGKNPFADLGLPKDDPPSSVKPPAKQSPKKASPEPRSKPAFTTPKPAKPKATVPPVITPQNAAVVTPKSRPTSKNTNALSKDADCLPAMALPRNDHDFNGAEISIDPSWLLPKCKTSKPCTKKDPASTRACAQKTAAKNRLVAMKRAADAAKDGDVLSTRKALADAKRGTLKEIDVFVELEAGDGPLPDAPEVAKLLDPSLSEGTKQDPNNPNMSGKKDARLSADSPVGTKNSDAAIMAPDKGKKSMGDMTICLNEADPHLIRQLFIQIAGPDVAVECVPAHSNRYWKDPEDLTRR